jgi:hypothetical protein
MGNSPPRSDLGQPHTDTHGSRAFMERRNLSKSEMREASLREDCFEEELPPRKRDAVVLRGHKDIVNCIVALDDGRWTRFVHSSSSSSSPSFDSFT